MRHYLLLALCLAPVTTRPQQCRVTFSASDRVTLETIDPDSIRILDQVRNLDTLLVGEALFDLGLLTSVLEPGTAPAVFELSHNYPNSFSAATVFELFVPQPAPVQVQVYNVLGRRVAHTDVLLDRGGHTFRFEGGSLASGVYFIRAESGNRAIIRKMLKTGTAARTPVSLSHTGKRSALARRAVLSAGLFTFMAYAEGYLPATLKGLFPEDGDVIHFEMLPVPPPDDFTSGWRGFNLLGKFSVEWNNEGYREEDFQLISEFGFNFVRLPVDYRTYTASSDWLKFSESQLQQIDRAVAWGEKYGIHVCLNLHRAPGYCVNPPGQPLPPPQDASLWTDAAAREAFRAHWAMFAGRYRDVPASALSFNLVNEPANVDGAAYARAVEGAIQAIRDITPGRIIVSDEVNFGSAAVEEILKYDVVMSPHFYQPMQITHYKAEWVSGADAYPEPVWPMMPVGSYLYGSYKQPWNTALELSGDFADGTSVTLHVHQVSTRADLRASLDGETVYSKSFIPGPGEGEWSEVIHYPEWNCYQNIYDRDYTFNLERDGSKLALRVFEGDWLTFSSLTLTLPVESGGTEIKILPAISDWGVPQASYRLDEEGQLTMLKAPAGFEDHFKMNGFLKQWVDLKWRGVPVFVGEWGVYNKTPHHVTLEYMANRLMAMQSAGLGWALWNFRGSFGILDSGREDVDYEPFRGHQLDRQMLELLQSYIPDQ